MENPRRAFAPLLQTSRECTETAAQPVDSAGHKQNLLTSHANVTAGRISAAVPSPSPRHSTTTQLVAKVLTESSVKKVERTNEGEWFCETC